MDDQDIGVTWEIETPVALVTGKRTGVSSDI